MKICEKSDPMKGEKDKSGLKICVAITGASGVAYGIRLLEILKELSVKTFFIASEAGRKVIDVETDMKVEDVAKLADQSFESNDIAAGLASGSFPINGMVICPCSMKTIASISHGYASDLITRAADCMLKEKKKLILVPRETPLNLIHLQNLLNVKKAGAIVLPAMPAFYHDPKTLQDLIDFIVGKILDQLDIPHNLFKRWGNNYDKSS